MAIYQNQFIIFAFIFYCSFQTKNGLGYSAHFVGSVLVLSSNKGPGKGFQASINFDFEPRKVGIH